MTTQRLAKIIELMNQNKLESIALNPGSSLFYLTSLHFHLMERPVVLFINLTSTPTIILPELEILKIKQSSIPLEAITYGDDPSSWNSAFEKALKRIQPQPKTIGVEPTQIRFLEMEFIRKAASGIKFVPANSVLASIRVTKDLEEIEKIRKAVKIAEEAFRMTLPQIKIGKTEQEIASELTVQLLKAGSDTIFPFQPIVSSGPNSANPHAAPTERKLVKGDMLVIDWGAAYQGYISDLTRTYAIGEITPKFAEISETVLAANKAGCEAVLPGNTLGSVDNAARAVISNVGYGEYFTHRTGHGIGLEGHEEPYVFSANSTKMSQGMCFTIEPGIYLPGGGGVRIEDNVLVTPSGHEVLSSLNRNVKVLNG
jgi:Xaa-Pro dipeptidase